MRSSYACRRASHSAASMDVAVVDRFPLIPVLADEGPEVAREEIAQQKLVGRQSASIRLKVPAVVCLKCLKLAFDDGIFRRAGITLVEEPEFRDQPVFIRCRLM